jgi:membrane-associated protease RseP (regulator of RpoE activity)
MSIKKNLFSDYYNPNNIDIELLKMEIGQLFPFYDIRINLNSVTFFCKIDKLSLEEKFELLRNSLSKKGYIPMLRYENDKNIIHVIKKPKRKEKSVWINIILMIATIITTILTGSILYLERYDIWSIPNVVKIFNFYNLFYGGLFFAFPLLSILFIHEMGHYYISKKHGIKTSLPFFIPVPPILPNFNIGTFGALISSSDPMPNKKALFDVGISGPLSGFIIAIPITIIGILFSTPSTITEPISGDIMLGGSILFSFLSSVILNIPTGTPGGSILFSFLSSVILNIPTGTPIDLSLTAFAGWIGLLITSINLLPAGQLDGGHIFRAFLGEKQKYAGWIAVFIMIFTGWAFFAFIIVFLIGLTHPPPLNDYTNLDNKRKLLFVVVLIILIICFVPVPIYSI